MIARAVASWIATIVFLQVRAAEAQSVPAEAPAPANPSPVAASAPATVTATVESSKPDQGRAGWVRGDGFRIQSGNGDYSFRPGLQGAIRAEILSHQDADPTISNPFPFMRPRIDGNLYRKWINYWVSMELGRDPPYLLDAYVELDPWDWFKLRVGQQWTALSRHEDLGPQQLLFPDFAIVADYFWPGRDKGVTAFGTVGPLTYKLGVYAGSGLRNFDPIPGNYLTVGSLTFAPLGKLGYGEIPFIMSGDGGQPLRIAFGFEGTHGKYRQARESFNSQTGLFTSVPTGDRKNRILSANFQLNWQRFSFFGEAYARRTDPESDLPRFTSLGAWAQADYVFYKKLLDFGVRFNWLNPSTDLRNDDLYVGEAMLAYFIDAPYLAVRLRYGIAQQQDPGTGKGTPSGNVGAVSIPATVGFSQSIGAQVNVYF